MREEELQRLFQQAMKKQVQEYFQQNATLSPEGDYYLVKVKKPKSTIPENTEESHQAKTSPAIPDELTNLKKGLSTQSQQLARAEAKAEADF